MVMLTIITAAICVSAIALSLRSVAVLGGAAPWTTAGWWLTIVYLAAEIAKIVFGRDFGSVFEYGLLIALTVAFIIAGVRDERQAEPWWWPVRRSGTRAEKTLTRRG